MRGCLYIADRGAEEYESDSGIFDSQFGICDICGCWIFDTTSEFEPQGIDWVWIDVCGNCFGAENLIWSWPDRLLHKNWAKYNGNTVHYPKNMTPYEYQIRFEKGIEIFKEYLNYFVKSK